MRILFVHPVTSMSIGDVARGYRHALERQGHEIADYSFANRFAYHEKMVPGNAADRLRHVSKMASETIVVEAMYHKADVVVMVSGLNMSPVALWLLGQVGIPAAVIFTESPYDDDSQAQWIDMSHIADSKVDLTVFTNDRYSAMKFGWHLLAPSFDPSIHRPVAPVPEFECDVVMVGTGWPERQVFLESVNWDGVDLRIHGVWPGLNDNPTSPLFRFYRPGIIDNANIAALYCSAKICINFNRRNDHALTPGPRVYEVAACGAFQLSDSRRDMEVTFGDNIPTFDTPSLLESEIRYYLNNPVERAQLAGNARELVAGETFDKRAASMVAAFHSAAVNQ